jgi:hypothetical protein
MSRLLCTVAFWSLIVTSSSSPMPPPAKVEPSVLTAVVSPGKGTNTVSVEYRNGTSKEVTVNKQAILTGSLALEVSDRNGRVIPTVPPPLPDKNDPGVRIPAGGVHRVEYRLNFFSPGLEGRYRVRTRLSGWTCEPVEIDVTVEP